MVGIYQDGLGPSPRLRSRLSWREHQLAPVNPEGQEADDGQEADLRLCASKVVLGSLRLPDGNLNRFLSTNIRVRVRTSQ